MIRYLFAIITFVLPLLPDPSCAASKSVTFYRNGALFRVEGQAMKGILEIPVPAAIAEGSLRVTPKGDALIERVDMVAQKQDTSRSRELERLAEQKGRLEDRLRALTVKEDIFKAAAKSQGGRTPRRTKSNPEPMQSIRQGTEYAIAQLETVYSARRKAEKELKETEVRIASLSSKLGHSSFAARIRLSRPNGRAELSYVVSEAFWKPYYDIRVTSSADADVRLMALPPEGFEEWSVMVSDDLLPGLGGIKPVAANAAGTAVASFRLQVKVESATPASGTSISITNSSGRHLPEAPASVYLNGSYVGTAVFRSMSTAVSQFIRPK